MGEIYIIDDSVNSFTKRIVRELKIKTIDYYELSNDSASDDFITNKFRQHSIEKIIIPVSLGDVPNNQIGFKLGLHIRLSSRIGAGNLSPIIFVTNQSLETLLIARADRLGLIGLTEGTA